MGEKKILVNQSDCSEVEKVGSSILVESTTKSNVSKFLEGVKSTLRNNDTNTDLARRSFFGRTTQTALQVGAIPGQVNKVLQENPLSDLEIYKNYIGEQLKENNGDMGLISYYNAIEALIQQLENTSMIIETGTTEEVKNFAHQAKICERNISVVKHAEALGKVFFPEQNFQINGRERLNDHLSKRANWNGIDFSKIILEEAEILLKHMPAEHQQRLIEAHPDININNFLYNIYPSSEVELQLPKYTRSLDFSHIERYPHPNFLNKIIDRILKDAEQIAKEKPPLHSQITEYNYLDRLTLSGGAVESTHKLIVEIIALGDISSSSRAKELYLQIYKHQTSMFEDRGQCDRLTELIATWNRGDKKKIYFPELRDLHEEFLRNNFVNILGIHWSHMNEHDKKEILLTKLNF